MLYLTHNTQRLALESRAAVEVASNQQSDDLAELKAMIEENKIQLDDYQNALSTVTDKLCVA
jgi:uncharacterized coiled-coil protein SlyX